MVLTSLKQIQSFLIKLNIKHEDKYISYLFLTSLVMTWFGLIFESDWGVALQIGQDKI